MKFCTWSLINTNNDRIWAPSQCKDGDLFILIMMYTGRTTFLYWNGPMRCILETMSRYIAESAFKNLEFTVITLHLQWRHNGRDDVSNSNVYSGADQRKHQSSASLGFVWEIHRWPVNSSHKWPVTRRMLPFDDVITLMHVVNHSTIAGQLWCSNIWHNSRFVSPSPRHVQISFIFGVWPFCLTDLFLFMSIELDGGMDKSWCIYQNNSSPSDLQIIAVF